MDLDIIKQVLAALERERVDYVVVGAVAINFLGLPRATEDLDIFVAPEAANIERLKKALRSVFADPSIEEISAEDLLGDYPAVQYIPPTGSFYIDILTRLGETYRFEEIETMRVNVDGLDVRVTTPRMLHRMKRDTVSATDRADVALLVHRFALEDD